MTRAGRNGDRLAPGRALDLITVGEVLRVVRNDEDRVVDRLPRMIPDELVSMRQVDEDRSFAELLRTQATNAASSAAAQPRAVSTSDG